MMDAVMVVVVDLWEWEEGNGLCAWFFLIDFRFRTYFLFCCDDCESAMLRTE